MNEKGEGENNVKLLYSIIIHVKKNYTRQANKFHWFNIFNSN